MRRTFMALTIAALALSGIAAAQVGSGLGKGYGLGFCWVAPETLKQQLGLTDEQVKKLTELRTEHLNKVSKIAAELASKQAELRTLWLSPQPDEKRIRELTEQVAKLRSELATERVNFQLEVRKILTPEQLSKLPTVWKRGFEPRFGFGPGLGLGPGPRWGREPGRQFAPPAPGFGLGPGLGLGPGPRWGREPGWQRHGWKRFAPPAPVPPAPQGRGWGGWGRRWAW